MERGTGTSIREEFPLYSWAKDYLARQYDLVKVVYVSPHDRHDENAEVLSASVAWDDRLMLFKRKAALRP
jgi:hypothetical protein